MKSSKFFKSAIFSYFLLGLVTAVAGQETKPNETQESENPTVNQQPDIRTAALRQLGLSREQVQQIRKMNLERKPIMEEAQRRLREANRSLDEAIYADQVNDDDVKDRVKGVQLAQAEVLRIRFMNELFVRKLLTADQLTRFRELRQRFEKQRMNFERRNSNVNGADQNRDNFAPGQNRQDTRTRAPKPLQ